MGRPAIAARAQHPREQAAIIRLPASYQAVRSQLAEKA
jgi:hypothetical protein